MRTKVSTNPGKPSIKMKQPVSQLFKEKPKEKLVFNLDDISKIDKI